MHDSQPGRGRRALLLGAGAACAAALTGCTTYDANSGNSSGSTPTAGSSAAGGTGAADSAALTSTSGVPEGGGTIITDKKIVVTQPAAGQYKAFSAVCTHAQCIVDQVANGTINCPCHGSQFSVKDGSVVHGPASQPLPPVPIKVDGTSIVQA